MTELPSEVPPSERPGEPSSRAARFSELASDCGAIGVLLLIHVLFFFQQYLYDDCHFPFDFTDSYYYLTSIWLRMWHGVTFPLWNPYGSLGYPEHLSMQSGAFYPPLLLLKSLGITYTWSVATMFQALHAFVGGVGAYALLRRFGVARLAATIGGALFLASCGFYTNAQHPDIVRAYGLVPWIVFALDRHVVASRFGIVLAALSLLCLLTGSYPGVIIAAVYCTVPFALWQLSLCGGRAPAARYSLRLSYAALIASLLAAPKFLPVVFLSNELDFVAGAPTWGRASFLHLLTMVYPYVAQGLPDDPTMRTLFLSPLAVVLALGGIVPLLLRREGRGEVIALLVVLGVSSLLLFKSALSDQLFTFLPGLRTSRFALAGFRPFFHLTLCLLAALWLHRAAEASWRWRLASLVPGVLCYWLLAAAGASSGIYPHADIHFGTRLLCFSLVCTALCISLPPRDGGPRFGVLFAMLAIGASAVYYIYPPHLPYWSACGATARTEAHHRVRFDEIWASNDWQREWPERPAREIYQYTVTGAGNIGMLQQRFSVNGYNVGIKITKTLALWGNPYELSAEAQDSPLMQYLRMPSRFIVIPLREFEADPSTCADLSCAPSDAVSMISFREDGARFEVNLHEDSLVIENELYFDGWHGTTSHSPPARYVAEPWQGILRSWRLPKGRYVVETHYAPPGWDAAKGMGLVGLLLLGLCALGSLRAKRAS